MSAYNVALVVATWATGAAVLTGVFVAWDGDPKKCIPVVLAWPIAVPLLFLGLVGYAAGKRLLP